MCAQQTVSEMCLALNLIECALYFLLYLIHLMPSDAMRNRCDSIRTLCMVSNKRIELFNRL